MRSIEQYRMVLEIERAGSVSKAAALLHLTQPYLSSLLKSIETELGFKLFIRSSTGVSLTKEGSAFIEYASEIQKLIEKIENIPKLFPNEKETFSIASFYSYTLLDLYYHFKTIFPEPIQYEEVQNSRISERVASRDIQMGILYLETKSSKRLMPLYKRNHLHFKEIYREQICVIVGNKHPLKSKRSLVLKELKPFPLLIESYKTEAEIYGDEVKGILSKFQDFKVDPLHFDNNRSLFYFLLQSESHFSVGLASHNLTNPFVKSGDLYYIPLLDSSLEVITGTLVHQDSINTCEIKAFSELLVQHYSEFQSKNSLTV